MQLVMHLQLKPYITSSGLGEEEAKPGRVRPHDLRRSFVTNLLEANIDINTVRQLVGHCDIKTTSRYDLHVPNVRRCVESIITFK